MIIAVWNVNSVRSRLEHLQRYLVERRPDALLLQELKCQTADFPAAALAEIGWTALILGQKSYNGVAILTPQTKPATLALEGLPGDAEDSQARYLEADLAGVRLCCLYLPNGNPAPGEKYDYKLAWMRRLEARATELLRDEIPFLLGGDFNVCPTDLDLADPAAMRDDALCLPATRAAFRRLLHLGLTDALRALKPEERIYSYWDYQAGAWPRDLGLRIDHQLLSPQLADRLRDVGVDRDVRGWEKASDHAPMWINLDAAA